MVLAASFMCRIPPSVIPENAETQPLSIAWEVLPTLYRCISGTVVSQTMVRNLATALAWLAGYSSACLRYVASPVAHIAILWVVVATPLSCTFAPNALLVDLPHTIPPFLPPCSCVHMVIDMNLVIWMISRPIVVNWFRTLVCVLRRPRCRCLQKDQTLSVL